MKSLKYLHPYLIKNLLTVPLEAEDTQKNYLTFSDNEVHAIDRDKKALLVANELKKISKKDLNFIKLNLVN